MLIKINAHAAKIRSCNVHMREGRACGLAPEFQFAGWGEFERNGIELETNGLDSVSTDPLQCKEN